MSRSDPAYGPIARLCAIADGRRRQRAQRRAPRLIGRQVGNGSPQLMQSGGVNGTSAVQQALHTGPPDGAGNGSRHDTQRGARTMEMRPSASARAADRQVAAALTRVAFERYSGSSVISMRSASPHRRSRA